MFFHSELPQKFQLKDKCWWKVRASRPKFLSISLKCWLKPSSTSWITQPNFCKLGFTTLLPQPTFCKLGSTTLIFLIESSLVSLLQFPFRKIHSTIVDCGLRECNSRSSKTRLPQSCRLNGPFRNLIADCGYTFPLFQKMGFCNFLPVGLFPRLLRIVDRFWNAS